MTETANATSPNARQFAFHANVRPVAPINEYTTLLDKAFSDVPLTRGEKDKIAKILYGLMGANGSVYKLAGWAWYMSEAKQLHRILVAMNDDGRFSTYYAPDKTSLRAALSDCGYRIHEMIDA